MPPILPNPFSEIGVHLTWRAASKTTRAHLRDIGRALLRDLIAAALGIPADTCARRITFTQTCPECGGGHGPLRALVDGRPGPRVGVSYSDDVVLVGIAPAHAAAFAVDLELDSPAARAAAQEALDAHAAQATAAPGESLATASGARADGRPHPSGGTHTTDGDTETDGNSGNTLEALRHWTRIEAVAKARGTGLRDDFAAVDFAAVDFTTVDFVLRVNAKWHEMRDFGPVRVHSTAEAQRARTSALLQEAQCWEVRGDGRSRTNLVGFDALVPAPALAAPGSVAELLHGPARYASPGPARRRAVIALALG